MHSEQYDLIIMGASLAGATLASHAAARGLTCLLIDQEQFPRRKACGEGLSIIGIRELQALAVWEHVPPAELFPFFGFRFYERGSASKLEIVTPLDSIGHGVGVSRRVLDFALLKTACDRPGVAAWLGANSVIRRLGNDSFEVSSDYGKARAPLLVLATGANGVVPDRLGIPRTVARSARSALSLIVSHSGAFPCRGSVAIIVEPHYQACVTEIGPSLATVAVLADEANSRVLRKSNIGPLLATIGSRLDLTLSLAEEPLGASGIGRIERPFCHGNIMLVGDIIGQLDPIGGMGMSHALIGAKVAAETARAVLKETAQQGRRAFQGHPDRMRKALRKLRLFTTLSYWSLADPFTRSFLGPLKCGAVSRGVLRMMHSRPETFRSYNQ